MVPLAAGSDADAQSPPSPILGAPFQEWEGLEEPEEPERFQDEKELEGSKESLQQAYEK